MHTHFLKTLKSAIFSSIFLATFCTTSLHSAESPKDRINEWITSCPYIGLVAKEVTYGPITLKHLDLEDNGRMVIAEPGEKISGTVRYRVNSDQLDSWHLQHILIGIKGQDNPTCITHSMGAWDKKGKSHFTLQAPLEKGVYEIRFDYHNALLCKDAAEAWSADSPSAKATVGIIIVE